MDTQHLPERTMIVELADYPELIPTIVGWIQREWPKNRDDKSVETRLCGHRNRNILPAALVALRKNIPVGFISLVQYDEGIESGRPYWIDAVYVEPSHRKKGFAKALLSAGEKKALALGIDLLFALTDIPDFYKKAGWSVLSGERLDSPLDVLVTKKLS